MKKLILLSLLLAQAAWAITIPVPLPDPGFVLETTVPIVDLNGIPIAGQPLTVDIVFTDGKFLRLFPSTPTFASILKLVTDIPPTGFPDGTATVLGPGLTPVVEAPIGAASSTDFIAAGLILPVLPVAPLDVYGLRYNLVLPPASAQVVAAELKLQGNGQFLIGPFGVPDTGHTAVLFGCGLFGIFCLVQRQAASLVPKGPGLNPGGVSLGTFR